MAESDSPIRAVGILTAGGDCPGLNAVIRAVAKPLISEGVEVFGILDGFTGLVEKRFVPLAEKNLSGLLTLGGTILGTSRDKPHKMPDPDGGTRDMTDVAVANYRRMKLDCLVCLGGGGTQKNALRLAKAGLNVVTLPKTIDNDVFGTDYCFGYDSALTVATEAIDRLHTTASSHHRVMVVDIMGNNAGWLALGAGVAGGADVILIPEIPYSYDVIAEALFQRIRAGKRFSIVAVAEGAVPMEFAEKLRAKRAAARSPEVKKAKKKRAVKDHTKEPVSAIIAEHIEEVAGLETRVCSLGHLQRGGIPTARDRLLSTNFGAKAGELILARKFGRMVALCHGQYIDVPLEEIAGKKKLVPHDHPLIRAARAVGTSMGDVV